MGRWVSMSAPHHPHETDAHLHSAALVLRNTSDAKRKNPNQPCIDKTCSALCEAKREIIAASHRRMLLLSSSNT